MSNNLQLIDHERNFMLEAAVQENRVVFVMTNGDHHHHRWMMRVDPTTTRKQLAAFLTDIPDIHEIERLHTIKELKERVWLLEEMIHELLIYASPLPNDAQQMTVLCKGGFTSELVPRLTQLGPVKVADRIAEIRALVTRVETQPDSGAISADPAMGAISEVDAAISGLKKDEV